VLDSGARLSRPVLDSLSPEGDPVKDLLAKAETLTEALPWIKRTWGRTVVIKYGGAAMNDPALREHVASDIVLMKLVGINPVIVHGGGPEITSYMERLGLPVRFHNGLRVTSDEAMEVVKMVLVGKVNKELVANINTHGRLAVGIAGDDANLIRAKQKDPELGRVGEVTAVDTTVVVNLIEDGFIPVIASVAAGEDGGSFNINADLVAGEIAAALGADKVIFLTDVDGLYADFDDKSSLISALTLDAAEEMIMADALSSGMIPKVAACAHALRGGVRRAHILNGTLAHALLLEVYTEQGVGTMIRHSDEPWLAEQSDGANMTVGA
jgi:acetylglutamate kinase